jgi:hypothetical protein
MTISCKNILQNLKRQNTMYNPTPKERKEGKKEKQKPGNYSFF